MDRNEAFEKAMRGLQKMRGDETSASSAQAPVENRRASQLVRSGSLVRLRSLGLVCVAQAGMALLMGALGIVDRWTVYPACYFSLSTFVGVWLMRDKPNK